jgi:hypothetical protein
MQLLSWTRYLKQAREGVWLPEWHEPFNVSQSLRIRPKLMRQCENDTSSRISLVCCSRQCIFSAWFGWCHRAWSCGPTGKVSNVQWGIFFWGVLFLGSHQSSPHLEQWLRLAFGPVNARHVLMHMSFMIGMTPLSSATACCYSTLASQSFSFVFTHCITSQPLVAAITRWLKSLLVSFLGSSTFPVHTYLIRQLSLTFVLALNLS